MPPPRQNHGTLRFDAYQIDLRAGELYKNGRKIRLQEQPFRILAILLAQPGQVVSREELRERLWPADTFVDFEHSLNTALMKLRHALNDEAEKPRFIETLPKRGYRYVGPAVDALSPALPFEEQGGGIQSPIGEHAPPHNIHSSAVPIPAVLPVLRRKFLLPLAVLLAAALAASTFFLFRRAPALTEKDTIVLTDFANNTGDAVFDDALKQGLAVQLAQSPFLSILSEDKVRDTLKLMGRAPGERLTADLARDLCQRVESKAYLSGSIASLGSQYVIGLRAVNCRTGDLIAQDQVQAARKEEVLKALGAASTKLREKLGESLSSIQKYDTPIEQATTPSLEALKALSLALQTGHESGEIRAIPFFKRAIELDPSFSLAYADLGYFYLALGEPAHAAANIQKAYELKDRVSDRERFNITALFYTGVTGDLEKANQTCELWASAYPRDFMPHLLLGLNYEYLGGYDKGMSQDLAAIARNPDNAVLYSNLMEVYTPVNRLEEAKTAYRQALARKLDGPYLHTDLYVVAFLENDAAEMQRQIGIAASMPSAEDWFFSLQSDTVAFSGRLAKARELSRQAVESARRSELEEVAAIWQMNAALREIEFGNAAQARQDVKEGLSLAATRDSQVLAALVLARTGDVASAQAMANALEERFPANVELRSYWLPSIRAAIALDRGEPAEALKALKPAAPYEIAYPRPQLEGGSLLYPAYLRGQAYLLLHQANEAATEFGKFIDHRPLVVNCPLGALARLWLARAYAMQRDDVQARATYNDFFTLWKDADPHIPVLQQAKAEYAIVK